MGELSNGRIEQKKKKNGERGTRDMGSRKKRNKIFRIGCEPLDIGEREKGDKRG